MSSDRFRSGDPGHVAEHNRLARLAPPVEDLPAAVAAGGTIVLPPGTFDVYEPIVLPSNVSLRGAGKAITILRYHGPGAAIRASDTARRYNVILADFTLLNEGPADVGVDMVNLSTSEFRGVTVQGFPTGFWMRGTSGGWCVYNELYGCVARGGQVGMLIDGIATNENKAFGGRYGGTDVGLLLRSCNSCSFYSICIEGSAVGIYLDGTAAAASFTDTSYFASVRLEGNGTGIKVDGTRARGNVFAFPHLSGNDVNIDDTGDRTVVMSHNNWPPTTRT